MFEDISSLGSGDPTIARAAALNVVQHVSQNKTDLGYLVKRLINGLESTKLQTRTGCYTTLCVLLYLQKIDPADLFDLMQKALITNKQSTKKERRLIYIARILCSGSILKSCTAGNLSVQEVLLQSLLHEVVDLSGKKAGYFQLAVPFLAHLLGDESLTQDTFDGVVWPEIKVLFENLGFGKKRKKQQEEDDEEEEEDVNAVNFTCLVQLALVVRNRGFGAEFQCLADVRRIVKGVLVCKLQFESQFLRSLFQSIKTSPSDVESFFTTLVENVKPTQFELLCSSVRSAVEEKIPLPLIISKRLVSLLLGVFKTKDTEFHGKSRAVISLLLSLKDTEDCKLSKKEKKSLFRCLFGGEAPNLLHEYRKLNPVVKSFIQKLNGKELKMLCGVMFENLADESVGVRMAIVYLNVLARIAGCSSVYVDTAVEIVQKLVMLAVGKEKVEIRPKEDEDVDGEEVREQIRACAREGFKSFMAQAYNPEVVGRVWNYVAENLGELSAEDATVKVFKSARKVVRKVDDLCFKYLVWGYSLRVLVDEKEVLSSSAEGVTELVEISASEDLCLEVVKFVVGRVVREVSPPVCVEGMFLRMIMDGRVGEEVIQELAAGIEIGGEDEQDVDDDEEEDEDSESDSDEPQPKKKIKLEEEDVKLDPAQIAKLKEAFGGEESDSEESIALEDATAEDLEKMDGALARVFAIKKVTKDEDNATVRALMRTLRLIDMFVCRNIKCMGASCMLMVLMPVVNCMKASLKLKKRGEMTTRVIGVVDNLCRVKRFSGVEDVVEGTLGTIVGEIYGVARERRYRVLREVLEHCVCMVVRCFLGGGMGKRDAKGILGVFFEAVDEAAGKLKRRKRRRVVGKGKSKDVELETSRFVRLGLEVIGEGWMEGRRKIEARIMEKAGEK